MAGQAQLSPRASPRDPRRVSLDEANERLQHFRSATQTMSPPALQAAEERFEQARRQHHEPSVSGQQLDEAPAPAAVHQQQRGLPSNGLDHPVDSGLQAALVNETEQSAGCRGRTGGRMRGAATSSYLAAQCR
eukprot:SM000023S07566  [mRNA]  locus=s23:93471:94485:- [translate_table: standard]